MIIFEPFISVEDGKAIIFQHARNEKDLNGTVQLSDGAKIRENCTTDITPSGAHIVCSMQPDKDTKVLDNGIFLCLNYSEWTGKDHQHKSESGPLPPLQVPSYGVSLTFGPSDNLTNFSASAPNSRPHQEWIKFRNQDDGTPFFWVDFTREKTKDDIGLWKAGEIRTYDLTILFNAPVETEKTADQGDADALEASSQFSDGNYLMVHGDITLQALDEEENTIQKGSGWFLWDTGTYLFSPDPAVFNVTNNFTKRMGFSLSTKDDPIWTLNGVKTITYLSTKADHADDLAAIAVTIGDLSFPRAGLFSIEMPTLENMFNTDQNKDRADDQLIGIVPFNIMRNYIFSMDYLSERIYLRPTGSVQRTFFSKPPLMTVSYVEKNGLIYCPISINHCFKGYALFDSGNDATQLDESKTHIPSDQVTSFMIGDYELIEPGRKFKPVVEKDSTKILTPPEQTIAVGDIGNDILKYMFTTIDPTYQKIYFEKKD